LQGPDLSAVQPLWMVAIAGMAEHPGTVHQRRPGTAARHPLGMAGQLSLGILPELELAVQDRGKHGLLSQGQRLRPL